MVVQAEPILGQRPTVVWLTGRPGAGKSTIAEEVWRELRARGHQACLLDGDQVRSGLCSDLGFSDADRAENIRRIAEVARLMADAGLIVLVSSISPFRASRDAARELFDPGVFFEAYVDTPLEVAAERDPKGLYARARRGELKQFTGIDSPYEAPEDPEIRLPTVHSTPRECAAAVIAMLSDGDRLLD
jgi:bifunctional enzyme CysN/CysC